MMGLFAQISTEIAPGASGLTWHFGAETDLLNILIVIIICIYSAQIQHRFSNARYKYIQCNMNILSDLFVSTLLQ